MKFIRNKLRASQHIYPLIAKNRGKYAVFPNKDCDVILEAFQRSGNTYAYFLTKTLKPELKIAHHTHSVAALKLGIKYKKPIITIVREPLDAIASACLYSSNFGHSQHSAIERNILDYITFHEFLKKIDRDSFKLFQFNKLVDDPGPLIAYLCDAILRATIPDTREIKTLALQAQSRSEKTRLVSFEQSTLRSASRTEKIKGIKRLMETGYKDKISNCTQLYYDLIS